MADDVQDIYVSTDAGTEWQSLSALAAEQVDAKLPIESVDGTVVVDGNASVFTVSTGGTAGLVVDNQQRVGINCDPSFRLHAKDGSAEFLYASTVAYVRQLNQNTAVGFSNRNLSNTWTLALEDGVADNAAWEIWSSSVGAVGEHRFSFKKNGDFVVETAGASIQTPSVRGLADNDSQITLGGNFVVSTAGQERVWVNNRGSFGVGANPTSAVNLQNTGSVNTGMRSDITHISSTRSAYSDGQLMVTTAAATADIQTMSGFRIAGNIAAGATVDSYWGCYVSTVPTGAGHAAGFRCVVNGDGADEGKPSASGFFNVYADGSAPNYFGGDVRITPTRQLNCSKIVGATAPDSDAAIMLGDQATLKAGDGSEYVPTDSASIATKKTVDDKIWVGTTAEYLAIDGRDILPTTLYCLTD
jgi:hypothetical protein